MEKFGSSMLWFWTAYIVVTCIGMLHTTFNIFVLKMKPMDENSMGEGYEKTKPYHAIYNIIIFPIFAWIYFSGLDEVTISNVIFTSLIWGGVAVVFDYFGWIVIKHPWSLTAKEFYINYQPWISIVYIVIFSSPFIAYFLM
ncbi:hypothetical protein [Haploplasma axanthum]|uniref:Uncharacterized protein n=1 Tax=Haploplasma axanthum TaxID=29552 RepID=A0A449BFN0_HAPAX|nr:hypothetical protein [Haploplasma axanthum]VEU81241.1 Uncharacterised protein [Haploplasma axanthum]